MGGLLWKSGLKEGGLTVDMPTVTNTSFCLYASLNSFKQKKGQGIKEMTTKHEMS